MDFTVYREQLNKLIRRMKASEWFYFLALECFLVTYFIGSSTIKRILPGAVNKLFLLLFIIFLFVKLYLDEYMYRINLLISILLMGLGIVVAITGTYKSVIYILLLIIGAVGIDFDKIINWIFYSTIIGTLIIMALSVMGIIVDYTFDTDDLANVHSYGFTYYTWLGFIVMALTMMYVYMRRNVAILEVIGLMILNFLLLYIHDTMLTFLMVEAFLALYLMVVNMRVIFLKGRIWAFLATILSLLCITMSFIFLVLYQKGIMTLDMAALTTLRHRLMFTDQAVKGYGIHLLGNYIKINGMTGYIYGGADSAFYIDSGWAYIVLCYGIVFSILIVFLYTILFRYIQRGCESADAEESRKYTILYIWMFIICGGNIVNNMVLDPMNMPLLFLIPSAITSLAKKRYNLAEASDKTGWIQVDTEYLAKMKRALAKCCYIILLGALAIAGIFCVKRSKVHTIGEAVPDSMLAGFNNITLLKEEYDSYIVAKEQHQVNSKAELPYYLGQLVYKVNDVSADSAIMKEFMRSCNGQQMFDEIAAAMNIDIPILNHFLKVTKLADKEDLHTTIVYFNFRYDDKETVDKFMEIATPIIQNYGDSVKSHYINVPWNLASSSVKLVDDISIEDSEENLFAKSIESFENAAIRAQDKYDDAYDALTANEQVYYRHFYLNEDTKCSLAEYALYGLLGALAGGLGVAIVIVLIASILYYIRREDKEYHVDGVSVIARLEVGTGNTSNKLRKLLGSIKRFVYRYDSLSSASDIVKELKADGNIYMTIEGATANAYYDVINEACDKANVKLSNYIHKDIEAQKAAMASDGVIIVVAKHKTKLRDIKREIEVCRNRNIKVLGLVRVIS